MNNKKVDENLNKIGKILLIVGFIVSILGIALGITGVILFGKAFSLVDFGNIDKLFSGYALYTFSPYIVGLGIVISIAGGIVIIISYIGEITSFADKKVVPAVQNGVEYVRPTVTKAAHSVSTGFNAAKNEFNKKD